MLQVGSQLFDVMPLWTFSLLLMRFTGLMLGLPGLGTNQVAVPFRFAAAAVLSVAVLLSGVRASEPAHMAELVMMMMSELTLGYAFGFIPSFVLAGLAVAGQTISGAIGLGQANMMDRSLGGTTVSACAGSPGLPARSSSCFRRRSS